MCYVAYGLIKEAIKAIDVLEAFNNNPYKIKRFERIRSMTPFLDISLCENNVYSEENDLLSEVLSKEIDIGSKFLDPFFEDSRLSIKKIERIRSYFFGDTLLHIIAMTGNENIIKFCLKKGIDFNMKNNLGETPIDVADPEVKSLLLIPEIQEKFPGDMGAKKDRLAYLKLKVKFHLAKESDNQFLAELQGLINKSDANKNEALKKFCDSTQTSNPSDASILMLTREWINSGFYDWDSEDSERTVEGTLEDNKQNENLYNMDNSTKNIVDSETSVKSGSLFQHNNLLENNLSLKREREKKESIVESEQPFKKPKINPEEAVELKDNQPLERRNPNCLSLKF